MKKTPLATVQQKLVDYLKNDLGRRLTNPITRGVVEGMAALVANKLDFVVAASERISPALGMAMRVFILDPDGVDVEALRDFAKGWFDVNKVARFGGLDFDWEEVESLLKKLEVQEVAR